MTRTEPAAGTGLLRAIRKWDLVALVLNVIVGGALIGWLFSSSNASDALLVAIAAAGGLLFYLATAQRWRAAPVSIS